VNRQYRFALVLTMALVTLLFGSYSCASSNSTAKAPATPSGNITSQPGEPSVTIPTADKSKLPVIQFSVAPASIAPGGTAVLSWNVTNATSVTIDHGIGAVAAAGTQKVSPAAPTTYKLVAVNDTVSSTRTVSLVVGQPAPPPTPAPTPAPTPKPTGK
jgi:hypothetical protein